MEELGRIREQGYAVNNEEIALGRASLATTIFGSDRRVVGAISQTGKSEQVLGAEKDSIVRSLQMAAGEISMALGYYPATSDLMKRSPKNKKMRM
jgi:DNA-binding IclR family transcriptional regulator